jgi:hypothetical protein
VQSVPAQPALQVEQWPVPVGPEHDPTGHVPWTQVTVLSQLSPNLFEAQDVQVPSPVLPEQLPAEQTP